MEKHAPGRAFLIIAAVVLYLLAAVMFYKGYDKMTNYYNSENYPILNENAYVGGDAYNYIINGTYATGFFVLGSGFLLSGTVCVATSILSGQLNDIAEDRRKPSEIDSGTVDVDELPDL
jgi:hypothetical protein